MAERKFTRSLHKPGSAAQVRESVSQAVRESTIIVKPQLIEPVDFEAFFQKNKTLLQNDPLREMLLFPQDDISEEVIPRTYRTVTPVIPITIENEISSLFTRQCIKTYLKDWHVINYKYKSYSGSYLQLPKLPRQGELEDQVYEVDTDIENGKDKINVLGNESGIIKEGFLLKGPEAGTDSFISLATKSFKRRYVCLRQEIDGTHILEFHKDERRTDSKGAICMDFCNKVVRSSKRSKLGFELQMSDGHKSCILAAENERELENWISSLNTVLVNARNSSENNKKPPLSPENSLDAISNSLPPSPYGYSTLKGLEHSKNPELARYARETDFSISLSRKENRQNLFSIYPDMQRVSHSSHVYELEKDVKPFKEEFGTRIFIRCDEISFKLLAPLETEKGPLCQVEPYITTLSIFDAKRNRKISEDFKFDVNHPYIRNMLPKKGRKGSMPQNVTNGNNCNSENILSSLNNFHLKDIGEEWLSYPKQAIFTVQHPESELYFVLRIEKVLQGGISQAADPYLRAQSNSNNNRLGAKVQKIARSCCQRLGHYRMPFAWAARPIFKAFSGELDTTSDFGPIYKQDGTKLSDEDLLRFLSEFKKPEKLKHLTVIPGQIKITIQLLRDLPDNTLTSSLVPLIPFPIPPKCEPTLEIEQFPTSIASNCSPYTTYANHLYVFPKSLKYENQKAFTKARNIVCTVEFKDNDDVTSEPLKIIYGCPGEPMYCPEASTAIVHHNINPDFYKEVKILLPTQLHDKHHILFTFHHISCEQPKNSKRRDGSVANVIGYAWLPMLNKGRLSIDDQVLPVSINLPSGYLSCEPLGLGKGYSGPEIRWVDGGKELFSVGFILASTVYCKDPHLHNFFSQCQRLLESKVLDMEPNNVVKLWGFGWWDLGSCPVVPSLCQRPRPQSMPMILPVTSTSEEGSLTVTTGSDSGRELSKYVKVQHGMAKTLKTLHAVDMSTIIYFLPTLLNELLHLLVITSNEDVALNTVRVLIHIVHGVHEAGKNDILHSYVQYVFRTQELTNKRRVVHEELVKSLNTTLKPANTDFLMINKFLRHSWFFFQVISKSMAQHLIASERIKMLRQERFPADYLLCIRSLVEGLVPHILQKHKELPIETKKANLNLAFFLKKCLSLMDRGFVFKLIKCYLEKFMPNDVKALHEFKFEFLEIICFHEHFIALNLPIMRSIGIYGHTKNMKEANDESIDFEHEYRLSEEFCRHHFLLGTLLQEIRASLCEVHEIRQTAICVFRNLLAKHAFDDRYQGKAHQARIASLYLPFISILLENFSSLHLKTPPATPPATTKAEKNNSNIKSSENFSNPVTPVLSRRSTVEPTGSLPASARNRDSNFLSIIAGQVQIQPSVTFANGSCNSIDSNTSNPSTLSEKSKESEVQGKEKDGTESLEDYKCHTRSQSLPFSSSSSMLHFDKMDSAEMKDLLVCFLYIVKHVNEELLISWWQHCSEFDILDFFQILELCLHQFKYMGKKNIKSQHPAMYQPKSMTLPARTPPPAFTQRCNSTYSEAAPLSSSEADTFYRALLEANMATEVGLIALDVLGLYSLHLKEQLLYKDGDNPLMKKIFDIYLSFLQVGQSEKMFKHLFAALRAFINKFPVALFQGNAILCGKLCFELLCCCNSKLQTVRNEACALLYLLMRSNFEFSGRKELTRVHLQLIVSVSRLLGDVVGLNNARLQESLSVINNYANSDKAMQNTIFPSEVKDLTKRIRTVLMATMQMKEHENDPEMLLDLQYQLATSYASTPALRKTWLESMARNHLKNGDYSEAAHCVIHIAAMEAEYLKQKCMFPHGCSGFKAISLNVEQDESNLKEDSGMHDIQYSQDTLVVSLEKCVKMLEQAERYEIMPEVYKLIVPIYEEQRNYEALLQCYKTLHNAYVKIVDVNRTGRRLLGKYYRVAFFGSAYFVEEAGKEYIYKEPKVTSLAEISERLYHLFCEKFGKDAVRMIMDSNQVNPKDLESRFAYIQVTHVVPYFDEDELRLRPTEFERNNNLRRFMFETPFTIDSNKVRGLPEEQCKRRTILTTLYSFPYVKKRIPVFSKSVQILTPIEVAIDEMQARISELEEVVRMQPTDLKKLQLKLQGSISVQVNAGPLAYAYAFLEGKKSEKYPTDKVMTLKEVYRKFIKICQEALELNGRLITSDQYEYHSSMKKDFQELVDSLSEMLNEKLYYEEKDVLSLKRTSLDVFNYISGSPGSSTA